MKDWEFSILETFESLGGEANLADVYARLEEHYPLGEGDRRETIYGGRPAYQHQVRSYVSNLAQKEDLIRQTRGHYSLSFLGRQRYLKELAGRQPHSQLVKQERKRRKLIFPVTIQALEEGGYLATCEAIQGCLAEGNTVAEALENLEDGAAALLMLSKREGLSMPQGLEEFRPNKILTAQLVIPLPE